jgi:hypothetical protein
VAAILLTRDAEEIFISNKALQKSWIPHNYADDHETRHQTITLQLSRSEYDIFKRDLDFHYALARQSFDSYRFFFELDYSEISSGCLPPRLFDVLAENARHFGHSFDWWKFGILATPLIKNPSSYEVQWVD